MNNQLFYIVADTEAMRHCALLLRNKGCQFTRSPSRGVTHLLLPAPAFQADGKIIGGIELPTLLNSLSDSVAVIGGNLATPLLNSYRALDLLQDKYYLAQNAAITAECALRIAVQDFPSTLSGTPVLVLGWGRIGKCLAQLLRSVGCDVTIAARKEADRAMATALGYHVIPFSKLLPELGNCRILFNTAPAMILPDNAAKSCRPDCKKIDLASVQGIGGDDVIWARGLPGKMAPEASGRLIAETVWNYCQQEEDLS